MKLYCCSRSDLFDHYGLNAPLSPDLQLFKDCEITVHHRVRNLVNLVETRLLDSLRVRSQMYSVSVPNEARVTRGAMLCFMRVNCPCLFFATCCDDIEYIGDCMM